MPIQETKRVRLNKQLAMLETQYENVSSQLLTTLNAKDHAPLELQLEEIEAKSKEVEQELSELDAQSKNANRTYLDFEDKIPHLDYSEARSLLGSTVYQSRKEGSLGLFLLHDCNALGGKWCLELIRHELGRETSHFRHIPVGVSKEVHQQNKFALLGQLGSQLNVEAVLHDADAYAKEIARKICASIQLGSVVLIEVKNWDYFSQEQQMVTWFIEKFWAQLVREFQTLPTRRNVKVIAILVADSALPDDYWEPLCYPANAFDVEKLVLLPLRTWKRNEVEEWISKYGGIEDEDQLTQKTDIIFNASFGGIPSLIYQALQTHLNGNG